jgi:FxsC-like protein
MSRTSETHDRVGLRASYFFLSYAHSPPLAGTLQADPDQWVCTFFQDLASTVEARAKEPSMSAGFFDQQITLSTGWKASIKQALGQAEVFVPLLSPGYYTRSWPGKEWASFNERLTLARLSEAERDKRIVPVLWIPMPTERPGLEAALALAPDEPAYEENGLRAMLRLPPYQDSYRRIVDRVAARIVALVESDPLGPSAAPAFDQVQSPFQPALGTAEFDVYIAAPSLTQLPAGPDPRGYSEIGPDWQAFPDDQELPLAEYAVQVAEQLDLSVNVAGIGQRPAQESQPGVLIIDPWLIGTEPGLASLTEFVREMPSWVLPLLVLPPTTDRRVADHAQRIRDILGGSATGADAASQAIRGVRSLSKFVTLMPILVTEAERRYLRRGTNVRREPQRRFWPRLTASTGILPSQEDDDA